MLALTILQAYAVLAQNLIQNGNFQSVNQACQGAKWCTLINGTLIAPWVMLSDYKVFEIDVSTWSPFPGSSVSMDLNSDNYKGYGPGPNGQYATIIGQTVPTQIGATYHVNFALNENYSGGPSVKTGYVVATGITAQTFSHSVAVDGTQFTQVDYYFVARVVSTQIQIGSTTLNSGFGPVIDAISMTMYAVPPVSSSTSTSTATATSTTASTSSPSTSTSSNYYSQSSATYSQGSSSTSSCTTNTQAATLTKISSSSGYSTQGPASTTTSYSENAYITSQIPASSAYYGYSSNLSQGPALTTIPQQGPAATSSCTLSGIAAPTLQASPTANQPGPGYATIQMITNAAAELTPAASNNPSILSSSISFAPLLLSIPSAPLLLAYVFIL